MAQTKRKRRSKHRGTAAGTVEARGRTGRKPTKDEKATGPVSRTGAKRTDSQPRKNRYDKPPTWKGALIRSAIVTAILFVALALVLREKPLGAVGACIVLLAIYVPFNYYSDRYFYRRRQAKLAAARSAPAAPRAERRPRGAARQQAAADAAASRPAWRRLLDTRLRGPR